MAGFGESISRGERHDFIFCKVERLIKERSKAIKVELADGIEFVVMALSTSNLKSQENRADRRGHFIHITVPTLCLQIDVGHKIGRASCRERV